VNVVLDNLDLFLRGTWMTVQLTVISFSIAFAVGVLVAVFRVSPVPPLRWAGTAWVETVRNTPLAVLFVLFIFGLPKAGILFPSLFVSAVIVLSAYTSTFVAETVRAGILSVARGQAEAARAIGLTFTQTITRVVLPQALRTVVAPLGSVFIALIKNSGIAAAFGVLDLTFVAERVNNETSRPIPAFMGAAVLYVALGLLSGWAIGVLEHRTAVKR